VLAVRPGITGPSQLCFRNEERLLAAQADPEAYYVTTLLPAKLALDLEYLRDASLSGDLRLIASTVLALWRPTPEEEGGRMRRAAPPRRVARSIRRR
jgi:lipopolysaccharide/colanic/teichoic acid biosynthesis glycosyltransferase